MYKKLYHQARVSKRYGRPFVSVPFKWKAHVLHKGHKRSMKSFEYQDGKYELHTLCGKPKYSR
jgi:hypothetical protein